MSITIVGGKFSLGQMVVTRGVADRCIEDGKFNVFVLCSFGRPGIVH